MTTKQRSILLYSLIVLFLIGSAWIVYSFFADATLTITTSDATNSITLQENSPNSHPIDVTQNTKQAVVRVEPGTYTIVVASASTSTRQVVKLSFGERKAVNLNAGIVTTITGNLIPITSLGADAVTASSDHLSFIDRNDANYPLYNVDSSNHVSVLGGSRSFQTIKWGTNSFGIGLVKTGAVDYEIVKIQGQSISNVTLPFKVTGDIGFSVAPDGRWYVSDGHIIYSANGDGSFTKVYSSSDYVRIGSASNQSIEITQQPSGASRPTSIAVLHNDGTKYQIAGELYEAAWSPSGNKLVTSGELTGVFDTQLNKIAQMPDNNVVAPIWIDDNTILYIQGSDIWRYSLDSGKSDKVAAIDPLVGNFSDIRMSDDHAYVYATVDRTGFAITTLDLYRFGLNNQQPTNDSSVAQKLLVVLPSSAPICIANVMNFSATSIVMKRNSTNQDCVNTTKNSIVSSKTLDSASVNVLNFQYLQ
ncbi:MAG: hypothetical protein JWO07_420 [Candidatus Saccharibacteria bacterium]|nr:hypothetical protein [Candidatus Saccharibacteria bacterium]